MSKPILQNVKLPSVDELFTGGALMTEAQEGQVQMLSLTELHSFIDHPFQVKCDDKFQELMMSISENGVLVPILVRPQESGGYEIVSGHRRTQACKALGMKTIPAIVQKMSDDEATIVMVDANIQREKILPSEKAKAYAMKHRALMHQGRAGGNTLEEMGKSLGEGAKTVQRYISLADLHPELLQLMDQGKLGLSQGYSLCRLDRERQALVADYLAESGHKLSCNEAETLRRTGQENTLDRSSINRILSSKPAKSGKLSIPIGSIRQFFSDNAGPEYMEQVIMELLKQWKERANE